MEPEQFFETKSSFETFLREQIALQEQFAAELSLISRQQKALLLIFGQAVEKIGEK